MSDGDRLLGRPFIGGYLFTRKIGEGGMGAVYLAENPELGTQWAVKVLLPERSASASAVARFKAEARAASRIRHRNIISIHDMGQLEDGRHYITMEYLEGTTLRRYARGLGRMPVDVTLAILAQVCAGLQAAHEQGIIHRDLKPSNIFVAPQPDNPYFAKVLDFGIAKLTDRVLAGDVDTKSQVVAGTPNYMSPEQARALRDVDRRTDLYAVGVLAYELLTGRLPYKAHSVGELAYQQASRVPARPGELRPDLPQAWDDLIRRAISLSADQRPQTAEALARLMIEATPGGSEIARACAPLLFTTMSESGSGGSDSFVAPLPRGAGWAPAALPADGPTGIAGDGGRGVSRTVSVSPEEDDFARFPGADDEEETRALPPRDNFARFSGADEEEEETRAATPAAKQRTRTPAVLPRVGPPTAGPPSSVVVDGAGPPSSLPPEVGGPGRGAPLPPAQPPQQAPPQASAASQSAPVPVPLETIQGPVPGVGSGYVPAPPPTTLGFSAAEKSSPGLGAAPADRNWLWLASGITLVVALAVAVFFIVVRAPSGVEAPPRRRNDDQSVHQVKQGEPKVQPMRPQEPAVAPLAVERDAGAEGDGPDTDAGAGR